METKPKKQQKKKLSDKDLIKKYEGVVKKVPFSKKQEMYLKQINRNYKEGDLN